MTARSLSPVYNAVRFAREWGATGLRAGLCLLGTLEVSPAQTLLSARGKIT
jgi:hypothetical protein